MYRLAVGSLVILTSLGFFTSCRFEALLAYRRAWSFSFCKVLLGLFRSACRRSLRLRCTCRSTHGWLRLWDLFLFQVWTQGSQQSDRILRVILAKLLCGSSCSFLGGHNWLRALTDCVSDLIRRREGLLLIIGRLRRFFSGLDNGSKSINRLTTFTIIALHL